MAAVSDTTPEVLLERITPDDAREGGGVIALLTLRDPKRRNAMSRALSDSLVAVLDEVEADDRIHAVVVTGAADRGPAFCAGGDLDELAAVGATTGQEGEEAIRGVYAGFLRLAACPLPTIAAVDGPAVGAGINMALAADIRLAGDTAHFEPGFLRLGIHPGGGMTWMTQRLVGPQTTLAMLLGGEAMDAAAAERAGLVLRRVPGEVPEQGHSPVVTEALRMAGFSARAPRDLVRATKASIRTTATLTEHADAVSVEVGPQLTSLRSSAFRAGLERLRRRS
ncbi:enoyl-CoA hydratase-related protein [Actinomycetospora sp. OC33-EN08]|uniref:Enoyl-CoA hydratase-related protein n=1 Tax=Actinomycetospora aurantiaca TaxID=3129233 RepID=A0ABU8MMB1_9PSEU